MEPHLPLSVAQVDAPSPPGLPPSLPQPSRSPFHPFCSPLPLLSSPSRLRFPSQSHPSLFGLSPPPFRPSPSPSPLPPEAGSQSSPLSPSLSSSPCPTSSPAPAVSASRYEPPPSRLITETERNQGLHKVTREKVAHRVVEHPRDAIVEYPETGDAPGIAVAHLFNIDPDSFCEPQSSFQYSLGGGHGGRDEVVCKMLRGASGKPVLCSKLRTTCKF